VTALLVPNTAGVAAAVCLGDAGTPGPARDCRTVLRSTVSLHGVRPTATAPAPAQVNALISVTNDLNIRRRIGSSALNVAATSGRQANAALLLSDDYKAIAKRTSAIEFTPLASASGRSLVQELNAASDAFGSVAQAADVRSSAGYSTALRRAVDSEAKISRSLDELTAFGYGTVGK
jgi:hypothetical protein